MPTVRNALKALEEVWFLNRPASVCGGQAIQKALAFLCVLGGEKFFSMRS
jgi:hypothetical protein